MNRFACGDALWIRLWALPAFLPQPGTRAFLKRVLRISQLPAGGASLCTAGQPAGAGQIAEALKSAGRLQGRLERVRPADAAQAGAMEMFRQACGNYIAQLQAAAQMGSLTLKGYQAAFAYLRVGLDACTAQLAHRGCTRGEAGFLLKILTIFRRHLGEVGVATPLQREDLRVDFRYYEAVRSIPAQSPEQDGCMQAMPAQAYCMGGRILSVGRVICYQYQET